MYTVYRSAMIVLTPTAGILIVATTAINEVNAGRPRHDYDAMYEDVPGTPECWTDGFDAGANDDYDSDRASECSDIPGDQYERAYELAKDICDKDAEVDKSGGDCDDAREADN
jgi:hypothetical protein